MSKIIFFDIESTGVDIPTARIISIGLTSFTVNPLTSEITRGAEKEMYFNPGITIPKDSIEIHGITDEMVKDKPTFSECAQAIYDVFYGNYVCGYNIINYDMPVLNAEMERAGLNGVFMKSKPIDLLLMYRKYHQMDLKACVKEYLNKDFEDHHNALADTLVLPDILTEQVSRYGLNFNNLDEIHNHTKPDDAVDFGGKLVWKGDQCIFNFSKHRGKALQYVAKEESSFLQWVLSKKDFSEEFRSICLDALNGIFPRKSKNHECL